MRLQRLFDMTPAELAFRGRQEVYKAVERLPLRDLQRDTTCRFRRLPGDTAMNALLDGLGKEARPANAADVQAALQRRMARRFFAGLDSEGEGAAGASSMAEAHAGLAAAVIARADAVCRDEFDILGHGTLSFDSPINWRLDPVSGRESPLVHWSRLDPLAPDQVGDNKVVWELNRHQWLLDLGQAWRMTGEDRYAEKFVALVFDWIERNPFARGINWSSALEVAMRIISWCWALCLFRGAPALDAARFQALLAELQRHASFVERNLSRYFSPNTHLTVEALALYYVGTLLPELQGGDRWRALGREILLGELPVQVPDSGVYFEQSTRYQYYTVEIYLHFALLAARNDDALPPLVDDRLRRLLGFLRLVQRPDGTVPQIGDTDGGWLCPLARRAAGDYDGLFATAALLLGDATLARAVAAPAPESHWLLGTAACAGWAALRGSTGDGGLAAEPASSVHGAGGYVIMRSGSGRESHQLIFDSGPLGCHVSGGHGHADLLSVQCSAFGENYLVDPGTGVYTPGSAWREHFRSTRAHSTLRVDDRDQAETTGPFAWSGRPSARLLASASTPEGAFAIAEHDAFARPDHPVTHRRGIWFLDAAAWLIVDEVRAQGEHGVELRFQFAPLPVSEEVDGWVRARGEKSCLLLKAFASVELDTTIQAGAEEPLRGWYSPNYGSCVPAPCVTFTATAALPLRLATLVLPRRDPDATAPAVRPRIEAGSLRGLTVAGETLSMPDFESGELSRWFGDGVTR